MLITTLGTSHGDATYCRYNTSTLIEIGGASYLVDAGAPVDALMTRLNKPFDALRAVFLTHMHDDHAGGLTNLCKAVVKYAPAGRAPMCLYLPEEGAAEALCGWLKAMHMDERMMLNDLVRFTVPADGIVYEDDLLRVTGILTGHIRPLPSYAYLFEAKGKRVLFSGDLRADFSDFPASVNRLDACFCEATHYPPEKALPVLMKLDTKRLCFYHIHNPWHGAGVQGLYDFYALLPYAVRVMRDGDELRL